eukprot:167626-Ditylum_brightwellii.AAC.1
MSTLKHATPTKPTVAYAPPKKPNVAATKAYTAPKTNYVTPTKTYSPRNTLTQKDIPKTRFAASPVPVAPRSLEKFPQTQYK